MTYLFEIIDPYSLNKQGQDVGEKYRTGIYSEKYEHLKEAEAFLSERNDYDLIVVEVLPLTNYVRSAEEHQDRLARCPNDYCHIRSEERRVGKECRYMLSLITIEEHNEQNRT